MEGSATVHVRPAGAAWGAVTQACRLVTGSGALVPPELSGTVGVVDLPVRIGDQQIDVRDDEELRQFYARLRNGETPETSTSPPGEFLETFRRCQAERILCLTIPARWSGMDDSARLAARTLAEEEGRERVTVVDTGTAAAGLGLITRVAARLCMDGAELPAGSGTVETGSAIFKAKCSSCHGPEGQGIPPAYPAIVGRDPKGEKFPFSTDWRITRTIGNYLPYATTVFDYVRRAMPHTQPGSLTDDEVYALTAYLLAANQVIPVNSTLDAATLRAVKMPYAGRFVRDDRRGGREVR